MKLDYKINYLSSLKIGKKMFISFENSSLSDFLKNDNYLYDVQLGIVREIPKSILAQYI